MSRQEFISGSKEPFIKDPEIAQDQIWDCLSEHDFGSGMVKYSIVTRFMHPESKKWICTVLQHQSDKLMGFYIAFNLDLSAECIKKDYQYFRIYDERNLYGTNRSAQGDYIGNNNLIISTGVAVNTQQVTRVEYPYYNPAINLNGPAILPTAEDLLRVRRMLEDDIV